jgi:hypothetical protein
MEAKDGIKNWVVICFCLTAAFIFYLYLLFVDTDMRKDLTDLKQDYAEVMSENYLLHNRIIYLEQKLEKIKSSSKD